MQEEVSLTWLEDLGHGASPRHEEELLALSDEVYLELNRAIRQVCCTVRVRIGRPIM